MVDLLFMSVDLFFFFKQKTAYEMRISDWSSDVCSSDLANGRGKALPQRSGRRLDSGQLEIFRMPRARAVQLAEIPDVVDRRTGIARKVEERIDQHRSKIGRASCRERVCQYV